MFGCMVVSMTQCVNISVDDPVCYTVDVLAQMCVAVPVHVYVDDPVREC